MNPKSDIGKAFGMLKDSMYVSHKGLLIEKIIGGYKWLGRKFNSLEAIDEELNKLGEVIINSIKK